MHWGWYWHTKLQHKHKHLCSWLMTLDSFELLNGRSRGALYMGQIVIEIPSLTLQVIFMKEYYAVTYNHGSYNIAIEEQPCNYGGFRYFFHCPACDKRMRFLYCDDGKFLCRQCLNLSYHTQLLRPSDRCLVMAAKIEGKLGSMAGDLGHKPPWMKKKAYDKLRGRHFEYSKIKYPQALVCELMQYYPQYAAELEILP